MFKIKKQNTHFLYLTFENKIHNNQIKKRDFSSLSKNIRNSTVFLTTKINYNTISKRNMLSVGKILRGSEKEATAKIFHLAKSFLRKKPLDHNDMCDFTINALVISPAITQHFLAVAFPKYTIPLEILEKKLSKVFFSKSKQTEIGLDQFISACAMVHRQNNPLFQEGNLFSLGNKKLDYQILPKTSQAYQNTSQEEPDYVYIFVRKETEEILWRRFYDWKTGDISPNSGHIYGTSNTEYFNELSEVLLKKQQKFYFKHPVLGKFLEKLVNQENLTWGEKNFQFQIFLKDKMSEFDHNINPSFIFKTSQFATAENHWKSPKYKMIEGTLENECFQNKIESETSIAKIFRLNEKTLDILDNYKKTSGHSTKIADICNNLWKDFQYL